MIFETKKVPLETLGEYLVEVRTHLGLVVSEVSEKTGIGEKFLQYLESGSYHKLPPNVYVFGFLKKLANLYAIPPEILLSQYKKERGIIEQLANEKIAPSSSLKSRFSKLVITPKLLSLFGGVSLSFVAVFYIIFQVSAINRTPDLELTQPLPGTVIKNSVVTVEGYTDPGTIITINGQNVFVEGEGKFSTTIGVATGQKELSIMAQNKYGKSTSQKVQIIVDTSQSELIEQEQAGKKSLSLEIAFTRPTTITLTKDGMELSEEVVPAGGIKRLEAREAVIVKTSDAGGTLVTVNGKELGPIGRNNESLTVPFSNDTQLLEKPKN